MGRNFQELNSRLQVAAMAIASIGLAVGLAACGPEQATEAPPTPAPTPVSTTDSEPEAASESGRVAYDFIINVTAGPLADNTYEGSFSYDPAAITGEGAEQIGVDDGLEATINFFGEDFTEEEDSQYPDFPLLKFEDGDIQLLDFWVEEGERIVWWNAPGWEVEVIPVDAE